MKELAPILILLVGVMFLVSSAHGATFFGGNDFILDEGDTVEDDLYVGARNISLSGDATDDVVVAGRSTTFLGSIGADLIAAGLTVSVLDTVEDDLRVVGESVSLHGDVGDDALIAGGEVYISKDASIGNDTVVAAGRAVLDGTFGKDLTIYAEEVTINGHISGNMKVFAQRITVGDETVVQGDFTYTSDHMATILDGAIIEGETQFTEHTKSVFPQAHTFPWGWLIGGALVGRFLIMFVSALVLLLLFKDRILSFVRRGFKGFGKELLRGFVLLIVLPFLGLLFALTLLGLPLALLLFLGYGTLLLVAKITAGILCGSWIQKLITKSNEYRVSWQFTFLGVALLTLVSYIPVLGWLASFVFVLVGFGVLWMALYQAMAPK